MAMSSCPACSVIPNHGVLTWGENADSVVRRTIAIEENAELAVRASSLGGANELSPEKAHLAAARRVNAVVGLVGGR